MGTVSLVILGVLLLGANNIILAVTIAEAQKNESSMAGAVKGFFLSFLSIGLTAIFLALVAFGSGKT